MLNLLFIGDIVGRPGREIVVERVQRMRSEFKADFVIANGENAAGGSGINSGIAKELLGAGVDAITLGDHVWDQKGWEEDIGDFEKVCRPANLPAVCPGREYVLLEQKGFKLAVFTLLGRQYLNLKSEDPFLAADRMLQQLAGIADGAFVEIHAEATSEKQGMGRYLDGRAIAVLGTHTHVATADACVFPEGTAFMCDVGMTGPYESILGRSIKPVVARFRDGMPRKFDVAENDVRISAALVEFDPATRKASKCELIVWKRNR
ncbi:MAG TPA: TIGR00282 family metallophosphoesterase [Opitutaceae bacterium]|nr:TIGR00282 family metallophosphoesterase [Opitutaceae bacterium]